MNLDQLLVSIATEEEQKRLADIKMIEGFIQLGEKITTEAVFFAVAKDRCDILELFINHDADLGFYSESEGTLLHVAINCNAFSCVDMLIKNGVDPEAADGCGETYNDLLDNRRE